MLDERIVGDVLRTVAFTAGGAAFLMSALIVILYGRRYLADRRLAKAQGRQDLHWRGLLPMHVVLIGSSYLLLILLALLGIYEAVGTPFQWRTLARTVAVLTGAVALWQMLRWQRRFYPRLDHPPTPGP